MCVARVKVPDVQEGMPSLANGSFEDPRLNLITGSLEPIACDAQSLPNHLLHIYAFAAMLMDEDEDEQDEGRW